MTGDRFGGPGDLLARITRLAAGRRRVVVGIAGAPGSGKSTVAAGLVDALGADAVAVPMDGFHLANAELRRLGLAGRKGAAETFDAGGFVALLRRLAAADEPCVYAPAFDRRLEEPVAGSIPIAQQVRYVLVEGNYLLLDQPPWRAGRDFLDEVWYLTPPESVRIERLTARHVQFGKSPEQARAWVASVDQPNAERIAATAAAADLVVRT
ncbi:MAG TPA: nucleoside/nucleotide kinase family protein [Frankiaceae bacterium]|nr:nucleoside/nucleotide kinase family protein [Frankiaceae bacterium]